VWLCFKTHVVVSLVSLPQTMCTLSLFNITDENIILSVRLPYDTKLSSMELLKKEKVGGGCAVVGMNTKRGRGKSDGRALY
jgi:hypothetical protein